MHNLRMCRICLAEDIRMHTIVDTHLQETYEKLNAMPFNTNDGRPLQVCYICYERLQNCHQLHTTCLKSEKFFTQMLKNNCLKPTSLRDANSLQIVHPLIHFSSLPHEEPETNAPQIDDDTENVNTEPSEMAYDVEVKVEDFEGAEDDMEHDVINDCTVTDNTLAREVDALNNNIRTTESNVSLSSNTVRISIDNVELEDSVQDILPEVELLLRNVDVIIDNDIRSNQSATSTEPAHKAALKMVKIVLNRIDFNCINTSAPVAKKPKLTAMKEKVRSTRKLETDVKFAQNKNIAYKKHTRGKSNKSQKKSLFKCDVCEMCFQRNINLNNHIRIHHEKKLYTCDKFEKDFSEENKYTNDITKHPYKCEVCQKHFSLKQNLNLHTRIHTGEKPYECKVCKKCFIVRRDLKIHSRIHTGEKPYKCNICNKSFCQSGVLYRHIRTHTGEKPYVCDICEKRFTCKQNLNSHKLIHIGIKLYKCDVCEKHFSQKQYLKIHNRIHTGEKPYKCDVCEKGFTEKGPLLQHARVHTREKPYKCDKCVKRFRYRGDLIKHTHRQHTGEKIIYKCDMCKKCFNRKQGFIRHVHSHRQ